MPSQNKNTVSLAETAAFGLSAENLSALRDASEKLHLQAIGSLARDRENELLDRQKVTPLIKVTAGEGVLFAIHYCEQLRNVAGHFANDLCRAVGNRKRFGKRERRWINEIICEFLLQKTNEQELRDLFRSCGSRLFSIENEAAAEQEFVDKVRGSVESQLIMRDAREAIRHADALYAARRSSPPHQPKRRIPLDVKLANPGSHPTLSVPEVMQALSVSRATVYRRLNEGKTLKRVEGGNPVGRRGTCRIQTASVLKCLEESTT